MHSVVKGPVQVKHEGSHSPQELSAAKYLDEEHVAHSIADGPVQVKHEGSHSPHELSAK